MSPPSKSRGRRRRIGWRRLPSGRVLLLQDSRRLAPRHAAGRRGLRDSGEAPWHPPDDEICQKAHSKSTHVPIHVFRKAIHLEDSRRLNPRWSRGGGAPVARKAPAHPSHRHVERHGGGAGRDAHVRRVDAPADERRVDARAVRAGDETCGWIESPTASTRPAGAHGAMASQQAFRPPRLFTLSMMNAFLMPCDVV